MVGSNYRNREVILKILCSKVRSQITLNKVKNNINLRNTTAHTFEAEKVKKCSILTISARKEEHWFTLP